MILYNVTIKVSNEAHLAWLQWMLDVHIPEILGTGCFVKHQVLKLLDNDESDGPTYAFQYFAESKANYNRYVEIYKQTLTRQSFDLWGDNFISFGTIMEVIN